jgi:hypothetical protein
MAKISRFYLLMGVDDNFDPSHRFETSWLLTPWLLGAWRALFSLFAFTTTFFMFGWRNTHGDAIDSRRSFNYFTNLTFWGISFYGLFSAYHTLAYARSGQAPLNRWPKILQVLHSLFYTTIVVFPFIVTIVYWAILYSGHWFRSDFDAFTNVCDCTPHLSRDLNPLTPSQVSQHALNSIIAFSEIVLPRTSPPPFLHIPFLILILGLYLGVAYITRATQDFYIYHFLNPDTGSGKVTGYCFGILAVNVVIFLVISGAIWLRRRVTEKKLGMAKLHPASVHSNYEDVEMATRREKS